MVDKTDKAPRSFQSDPGVLNMVSIAESYVSLTEDSST